MEGSKVSEARRIPAFFDELYGIQDKNHGYGEDGEDGDHDQEFDEGEALGSFGGHIKYPDTEADSGRHPLALDHMHPFRLILFLLEIQVVRV